MNTTGFREIALRYRKKVAGAFVLVDGDKISEKVQGLQFHVTRKFDGVMQVVFLRDGEVCSSTSGGTIRDGLPCLEEFASLAKASGIANATIVAELYVCLGEGRERVADVSTALADPQLNGKLCLAPFDIIDVNGDAALADAPYGEKIALLKKIFSGSLVSPVECKMVSDRSGVQTLYEEWVLENGYEGLVVHSDMQAVYKIKQRHSLDAVVIGYTVGENGEEVDENSVRDILLAMMLPDGTFQKFALTATGFKDDERKTLCSRLSEMTVESDYIETDSRNIAFHMIRPEIVVETTALDLVAENSAGEAKVNVILSYDPQAGYKLIGQTPGVAAHSIHYIRERDDKSVNPVDLRISQLTDICPFAKQKMVSISDLPKSEIIIRRLFTKGEGAKLMVQKFVVWKTNKEESGAFPAYVFHYTDYSIGRKEQLKRDIRVSNSREQIMGIFNQFVEENVKKGWVEVI